LVEGFFCQFFRFPKFPFSLEPKLFIPSDWSAVFFPDFAGAPSDLIYGGRATTFFVAGTSAKTRNCFIGR
jgi:hypothetical protein